MACPWPWNQEMPALGVLREFAKALGDGKDCSALSPDQSGFYLGGENCKTI